MTLDHLAQSVILAFGVSAIWFSGSKTPKWRMVGASLGLLAQPAWLYTTIANGQYAISAMCMLYGFGWVRGFVNHRRAMLAEATP